MVLNVGGMDNANQTKPKVERMYPKLAVPDSCEVAHRPSFFGSLLPQVRRSSHRQFKVRFTELLCTGEGSRLFFR
jgi:hypothetical protein